MKKSSAAEIVKQFNSKNGPKLSLFEAMSMHPIPSDGIKTYALQKGDVTFLAWIKEDGGIATKVVCW